VTLEVLTAGAAVKFTEPAKNIIMNNSKSYNTTCSEIIGSFSTCIISDVYTADAV